MQLSTWKIALIFFYFLLLVIFSSLYGGKLRFFLCAGTADGI
jgi:hypothetical protein